MMQQYSIHKTGKQYVVQAKGKDLLICESRREAEHIISGVATTAETSVSQARPLTSLDGHRVATSTGVAANADGPHKRIPCNSGPGIGAARCLILPGNPAILT